MSERLKSRFTVYQFLVGLCGFRPTIWRRLRVADCTLAELHEAIQVAFGLCTGTSYRFARHRSAVAGMDAPALKPGNWLNEILSLDGVDFRARYEAGPSGDAAEPWRLRVWFEGWMISSFQTVYPFCVEGERAGIPKPMTPRAFGKLLDVAEGSEKRDADGLQR